MKHFITLCLIFSAFNLFARQTFQNQKGGYQITVPEKWKVEEDLEITSVYAPDEGEMDTWQEKLEISVIESNDMNLEDGFAFYVEQDLPALYNGFKIVKQGDEIINGLNARWAVFSFSGSGTIGTNQVSFTLHNLFYLILKDGKFYMLNGIAERDYYPRLEKGFLEIVRSFRVIK